LLDRARELAVRGPHCYSTAHDCYFRRDRCTAKAVHLAGSFESVVASSAARCPLRRARCLLRGVSIAVVDPAAAGLVTLVAQS